MLRFFSRREPTADEARVFASLAADASSLGSLLRRTQRIKLDRGEAVNLADGDERELLGAALLAGARQHVRAGEDVLTLLERLDRMMDSSLGKRDAQRRTELGIMLLRAMAICELLDAESRDRFPGFEPLERLSREAARVLADGYARALGTDMPPDLRRVFPRFARAVREAGGAPDPMGNSLLVRFALGQRRARRAVDPHAAPTERLDTPSIS
jgi:hypothetical protein